MRKLQTLLYVVSIVIAIGIGMFKVSVIKPDAYNGGGGTHSVINPTCTTAIGSSGFCTSTASKLQSASIGGQYKAASGSTTYCNVSSCVAESHGNFVYDSD
jgi:hypothetical protein